MYQVKSPIPDHLADELEAHFCESEELVHWSIESIPGGHDFQLFGFFENPEQADEAWINLREDFPDIPESKEGFQLPDRDWVEKPTRIIFSLGLAMAYIGCRSGSVTTTRCQRRWHST